MLHLLAFGLFALARAFNDTALAPPDRYYPSSNHDVPLVKLTRHLLAPENYDTRVRPILNNSESLKIHISMSLYQIIEVNEPAQNIKMNVWMIQKWVDELLDWDPHDYAMINTTILPFDSLWIPDTYLYNSVVMNRDETERYMNIQVQTRYWEGKRGAQLSFLYPAIYTITCRLNIRYFPYDQQNCTLTISSWTNSKSALDYYADDKVNLASFIQNEEWDVISFKIYRHEYKYACCPEPWVILEASLIIRRKPLYYIVNLIIPTSIITIVSITGFFTPASTNDDRTEKINLGITTLLAMSILMLMVSDQMPTTSEFVPLIAWFYLSIIILISIGTFLTSIVLSVQGRRQFGRMPALCIRRFFLCVLNRWLWLETPPQLIKLWKELNDHPWMKRKKTKKDNKADGGAAQANNASANRAEKDDRHRSEFPNRLEVAEPLIRAGTPRQSISSTGNTSKRKIAAGKLKAGGQATGTGFSTLLSSSSEVVDRRQSAASSLKMIDSPTTPTSLMMPGTRGNSLWDSALILAGLDGTDDKPGSRPMSIDVLLMKRKRQCALEWEFLATVLDRFLLILFTFAVVFVTAGMIYTGMQAQSHYDSLIDTH